MCQPRRSVGSAVLYGVQQRCAKWFCEQEKIQNKKSQRLHNEIFGLDVKQHAPKGYKTVQRDARMQDREQRQDRQSVKYKNGDGHAQDIPEVLAS